MYIRRKLYSNIDGELVPVNETKLFAAKDDAKGAAAGAGIAAGTAGVGAAGVYGASKLPGYLKGKMEKALEERNSGDTLKKQEKAAAKYNRLHSINKGAEKAAEKSNKILGWLKNSKGIEGAQEFIKNAEGTGVLNQEMAKQNSEAAMKVAKKIARNRQLGTAAAVIGTGAAVGAGVKHLKDKKAEKQYSVLMTEEELKMFSEIVEDTGKGAGIAAGTLATAGAGAVGAKYGAGKIVRKMAQGRTLKAKEEKNEIMKEAAKKAADEKKKWAGKGKGVMTDRVKDAINSGKAKASQVKIADAGKIEKGIAALAKGGATATKWVIDNPKLAAGIAVGTIAAGGAAGAGIGAIKDKK